MSNDASHPSTYWWCVKTARCCQIPGCSRRRPPLDKSQSLCRCAVCRHRSCSGWSRWSWCRPRSRAGCWSSATLPADGRRMKKKNQIKNTSRSVTSAQVRTLESYEWWEPKCSARRRLVSCVTNTLCASMRGRRQKYKRGKKWSPELQNRQRLCGNFKVLHLKSHL